MIQSYRVKKLVSENFFTLRGVFTLDTGAGTPHKKVGNQ